MGYTDYPLNEFASRLAGVEEKYAKELQGLVECFGGSRVDLPVKKLEELAKAKGRTARRLKKVEDKRGELYTLWKLCNIYSITAVEVDEAMRETRGSLRKRIKMTTKDPSPFRKLVDEYRPASKQERPQEIYDSNRSNLKEKRFLDLFKKKDIRKVAAQDAEQSYTQNLVDAVKANYRSTEDKNSVLPPKPPPISSVTSIPTDPAAMPPVPPTDRISAQQATQAVQEGFTPVVKIRTASTKERVEEAKRLSMPTVTVTERQANLPPTAPPRKDRKEYGTSIKRASPALPPRPKPDVWKKTDMNRVPQTVIQLDGKVPVNPPQLARKSEHATNIQIEDTGDCSPPSPSTTIHVGRDVAVAMSPKVSNERVQRLQPESVRARPVQQAQIVNISGEKQTVDRF